MLNLTGDDIITMLLKDALITDTSEFLVAETDFPACVRMYKETGDINGLVELLVLNDCVEGNPEFYVCDDQLPQYLTLNY